MITKKGRFAFKKTTQDLERLKRTLPRIAGEAAKNHFLIGFRKGGGQTDKSISGWKPRATARTPRAGRRSQGRALLVRSGALRADIAVRGACFNKVAINVVHIPYAAFHNRGTARMPQREFMGKSKALEQKIERIVRQELKRVGQ